MNDMEIINFFNLNPLSPPFIGSKGYFFFFYVPTLISIQSNNTTNYIIKYEIAISKIINQQYLPILPSLSNIEIMDINNLTIHNGKIKLSDIWDAYFPDQEIIEPDGSLDTLD